MFILMLFSIASQPWIYNSNVSSSTLSQILSILSTTDSSKGPYFTRIQLHNSISYSSQNTTPPTYAMIRPCSSHVSSRYPTTPQSTQHLLFFFLYEQL